MAVHHLCAGKNGMSAHELHRTLGITYKSAWFMAHRIRYAMTQEPLKRKLGGTVEVDDTYVGGRIRRANGAPLSNKTSVISLVQRDGEVRSQVMPVVTGANIAAVLRRNVDPSAALMTDEWEATALQGRPAGQLAGSAMS